MSTCKDCLHLGVCEKYKRTDHLEELKDGCIFFKDRSKFIELPCKIGGVFYGIDKWAINAYSCWGVGYGYIRDGLLGFLLFTVGHREYIFGEEAFLTYEDAEKSIEGAIR